MFESDERIEFPAHFEVTNTDIIRDIYSLLVKRSYLTNYPKQGVNTIMYCLFHEISYQLNYINCTDTDSQVTLPERIKEYVINTLFRNISVHDVAAHFGLCDDYINRVFYKYEHITLKAYINKLRIKRLEEYLISTNTSLEVIARTLGFQNKSTLSKFYKYHTGRTITEFRSKFRN